MFECMREQRDTKHGEPEQGHPVRQGACGEVPGEYWELQCSLHGPIGLRRVVDFFMLQELTCPQITCQKLRREGEDKEGWLSSLCDKDTPITLLLLAELTPAQRLVHHQAKLLLPRAAPQLWTPELILQESRNPPAWDAMLLAQPHTPASYRVY